MTPASAFGNYRLLEKIGDGPIGEVFRAVRDEGDPNEQSYALKRVHAVFSRDPQFARTFLHGAGRARRLSHPNLASAVDHGEVQGLLFSVADYRPGHSLTGLLSWLRLRHSPVPPYAVVPLLLQLCEALRVAHRAQADRTTPNPMVHGDLKPSNILVDATGAVTLLDLGTGMPCALDPAGPLVWMSRESLRFLAPEQARGGAADVRSDVYALGALMFEMLSLEPFIAPGHPFEMMRDLLEVDLTERLKGLRDVGVDPELIRVVRGTLERKPKARFPDAGALADALRELELTGSQDSADYWQSLVEAIASGEEPARGEGLALHLLATGTGDSTEPWDLCWSESAFCSETLWRSGIAAAQEKAEPAAGAAPVPFDLEVPVPSNGIVLLDDSELSEDDSWDDDWDDDHSIVVMAGGAIEPPVESPPEEVPAAAMDGAASRDSRAPIDVAGPLVLRMEDLEDTGELPDDYQDDEDEDQPLGGESVSIHDMLQESELSALERALARLEQAGSDDSEPVEAVAADGESEAEAEIQAMLAEEERRRREEQRRREEEGSGRRVLLGRELSDASDSFMTTVMPDLPMVTLGGESGALAVGADEDEIEADGAAVQAVALEAGEDAEEVAALDAESGDEEDATAAWFAAGDLGLGNHSASMSLRVVEAPAATPEESAPVETVAMAGEVPPDAEEAMEAAVLAEEPAPTEKDAESVTTVEIVPAGRSSAVAGPLEVESPSAGDESAALEAEASEIDAGDESAAVAALEAEAAEIDAGDESAVVAALEAEGPGEMPGERLEAEAALSGVAGTGTESVAVVEAQAPASIDLAAPSEQDVVVAAVPVDSDDDEDDDPAFRTLSERVVFGDSEAAPEAVPAVEAAEAAEPVVSAGSAPDEASVQPVAATAESDSELDEAVDSLLEDTRSFPGAYDTDLSPPSAEVALETANQLDSFGFETMEADEDAMPVEAAEEAFAFGDDGVPLEVETLSVSDTAIPEIGPSRVDLVAREFAEGRREEIPAGLQLPDAPSIELPSLGFEVETLGAEDAEAIEMMAADDDEPEPEPAPPPSSRNGRGRSSQSAGREAGWEGLTTPGPGTAIPERKGKGRGKAAVREAQKGRETRETQKAREARESRQSPVVNRTESSAASMGGWYRSVARRPILPDGTLLLEKYRVIRRLADLADKSFYEIAVEEHGVTRTCWECGYANNLQEDSYCYKCGSPLEERTLTLSLRWDRRRIEKDVLLIDKAVDNLSLSRMYDQFIYEGMLCRVLEPLTGELLQQLPEPLDAAALIEIGSQSARALAWLHERGVSCPFLSADNIYLNNGRVQLYDLDVEEVLPDDSLPLSLQVKDVMMLARVLIPYTPPDIPALVSLMRDAVGGRIARAEQLARAIEALADTPAMLEAP